MSTTDAKINVLTSRITQPSSSSTRRSDDDHSDLDDEELFAQLEEEIENNSNLELREQGIQRLKAEWGAFAVPAHMQCFSLRPPLTHRPRSLGWTVCSR